MSKVLPLVHILLAGMLLSAPPLGVPDLRSEAFQAGLNLAGVAVPAAAQGSSKRGPSRKGFLVTLGVAIVIGTAMVLLKPEPRENCWFEGGLDPSDPEGTLSRFRCETR